MKIVLGIILIILIIAIAVAAWFFLKKKQSDLLEDTTPTLPPSVRETAITHAYDEAPITPSVPVAPSIDQTLSQIDGLINAQQYDKATGELKRLLITNPQSSAVMLKLLQVYALTGNQGAFEPLYQTLLGTGDQNSIQNAQTLQMLLNDSMQPAPTAQQSAPADDGLNFDDLSDFGLESDSKPTTAQNNVSDDLLDLDFGSFDETPTQPAQKATAPAADEGFDLDFGDFDNKAQDNTLTELKFDDDDDDVVLDLGAELTQLGVLDNTPASDDFSLDLEPEVKAEPTKPSATAGGLDFDVEELSLEPTPAPSQPTKQSADLGLDFDFGDVAEETKPSVAPQTDNSLDLQADFGLQDLPSSQSQAPSLPSATDGLAFDLGLDDGLVEDVKTTVDTKAPSNDLDFGNDFALDDTPVADLNAKPDDISLSLDDNIGFEFDVIDQTPATPEKSESPSEPLVTKLDDFQVDFSTDDVAPSQAQSSNQDLNFADFTAPAQPASEIIAPVLSSMVNTDTTGLTAIDQVDNAQITLDLAKNYLSLGEHDSAKRLLQEVMQAGNSTQQQQAYTLLNRLG